MLDIDDAFAGDNVVVEAVDFERNAIATAMPFAIGTAQTQAAAGRAETAAKAERLLSEVAKVIVLELGVRRLLMAGGYSAGLPSVGEATTPCRCDASLRKAMQGRCWFRDVEAS
ncbi:hypothetical protein [Mesorhizobium sp. URHB0026]